MKDGLIEVTFTPSETHIQCAGFIKPRNPILLALLIRAVKQASRTPGFQRIPRELASGKERSQKSWVWVSLKLWKQA